MNANGKSDEPVVPATSANNDAAEASAESTEERGSTERNAQQDALCRTQDRNQHRSGGLLGVREAARKDSQLKFTNLLHHLWMEWWRRNRCRGEVIVVRYADDFVMGFQHRSEAQACLEALRTRFAKFGLQLHPDKTRLIEFGRYAADARERRGEGRPETFDFLGFTHGVAKTRAHGRFTVHRYSSSKRLRATLHKLSEKLRKRMHCPLGETGRWLRHVVQGWLNYHAVPFNSRRINQFVKAVTRLWLSALRRRSQRGRRRWTWERMARLAARHVPRPKILHPYPHQRFHARFEVRAV